jgi:hypothetical protein
MASHGMTFRNRIGCMLLVAASCGYPPPQQFSDAPLEPPPDAFAQQAYVKASNTNVGDKLGFSVALSASGLTLAVGAPREDSQATGVGGNEADNNQPESGAVYVFTRADTMSRWTQQAYVKASNTGADAVFGTSVALSADGSTLAVSAQGESSDATGVNPPTSTNSAIHSGAVYVFVREGATWTQQAFIKASNTVTDDQFGSSLALSAAGATLVVGALNEGSDGIGVDGMQDVRTSQGGSSGAVYVFTRTDATWSQQAYVKASDSRAYINFGLSVAVSGDGSTLAVGTEDTGSVYVFARAGTTWIQKVIVGASSTESGDRFGFSLALSDDGAMLAVGAPFEASAATGVNGNQADNSAPQSGAVYVFTRAGALWTQRAYVKASNTGAGDQFGCRLALSADGLTFAVGAQFEASMATGVGGDRADNSALRSGAVHVFESVGTALVQRHYVKASNTGSHDQFGASLALSGDGSMLVVGAVGEASAATGVDGDQAGDLAMASGAVYMFQ